MFGKGVEEHEKIKQYEKIASDIYMVSWLRICYAVDRKFVLLNLAGYFYIIGIELSQIIAQELIVLKKKCPLLINDS